MQRLVPYFARIALLVWLGLGATPVVVHGNAAHPSLPAADSPRTQMGETLWLAEDFEDGQAQGWHYNPAQWQIVTDGESGSQVWTTYSGEGYASAGSSDWSDYRFRWQARRVNSSANVYFRNAGATGYALRLEESRLVLWTERSGTPQDLAGANFNVGSSWHTYEIEAAGSQFTIRVDGAVALSYTDSGPASLRGGIALEAFTNDGTRFDNIQVFGFLAEGEPAPWVQTNGPTGGAMNTIEIHPANPDKLFAGGSGGALYQTTNAGASWTEVPQFAPSNHVISDIVIPPTNPQVIYVLAGRIYKSSDGGQSWTNLTNDRLFSCVAMDSANPARLVAGNVEGQVFLSSNGGTDWNDVTANLPGYRIKDVAFGDGNELWAGTGSGDRLLYHSLNGGGSWSPVSLGQAADSEIHTLFVDPQNRDTVYAGLGDIHNEMFDAQHDVYLLKTVDGGAHWAPLRLPATDAMVNVMGRAPGDTTLYAASGGYTYRSGDGGQSWASISPPGYSGDVYDIAVDPGNPRVLYLPRRAHGIVKSTDQGATWAPINEGLLNTVVSLIALGDSSGRTIYAASVNGEGTFKSTDYGGKWTNVTGGGITHPWADELVVTPSDPQTVWEVADVGEVFVSTDGGTSWSKRINTYGPGFRAGTVSALAVAPSHPDVIYAVKSGFGIFKSSDGGHSWPFLHQSEVDYTYSLAVHPSNPNLVLSGYSPKLFQDWAMARRSTDGGVTWSTVLTVPHSAGITSIAIDPNNPNIIYAGSTGSSNGGGGQIYYSTNGGTAWSRLNPHFTMLTVWGQPQLVGDPNNPSTVYAATWLAGTWKTTDAGQTWTLLDGAPQSSTALSLDSSNPNVIYSADRTSPHVWKSTDGGLTWRSVADFSAGGAFLTNRVLAAGGAVYASTFGPGMHDGKLYKSANGGANWTDVTHGLPRSVLDAAVDPANPQVVYVTTHIHGAYKTTNGGTTWTEMADFPTMGGYDIEVDPVSPNIVYAAGMGAISVPAWVMPPNGYTLTDDSGVYKSTNGGQTWSKILTTGNECRAIRLHPLNHNILFAASLGDGLQVSTNGGSTWQAYNSGLDSRALTAAWVGGDKIYVGTQGFGVYSGDVNTGSGAATWRAARSNKPIPDVHSLQIQVEPGDASRIYVGANPGGLFRSDDGGATFYDKNFLTPSVVVDDPQRQGYYTFAINPNTPSEVWVGTWGKGIYKSYDRMDFDIGANGTDRKMYGKRVNALLIHPSYGVLAATEEGVFRTTNGGQTWTDFSAGLGTSQVRTLNVDSEARLIAGTAGYELYSRRPGDAGWQQVNAFGNYGTLWPIWNNRPMYQYSSLLFHPTDANILYLGTFPAGIFKSLDGGQTWREYNVGWTNDGVFTLVFHPQNPNVVYAGTYNGLNRSLDAGAHWGRWDTGWPAEQWVFSIDFDPRNPDVMYACSKNGENEGTGRPGFHGAVMKSTDGGAHWFEITTNLDVDQEFYKIIVDKFNPDTLYLAMQYDGVYISHDGGAGWQPWNDGLTNQLAGTNGNNVTNTMVRSANGLYLYFGSAGSGVFRRMTVPLDHAVYLPLVIKSGS
jgi:photosystem II stability/assembly factor-like uncharacterized protein